MAVLFGHKFPMVSDMVADTCDHCVNETQNCETRDTSVIITFVLGPDDQTQPGSLSLSLTLQGWVGQNPGNEVGGGAGKERRACNYVSGI